MLWGETQVRCAPDRATVDVVGLSAWLRRIASTDVTSSCGSRQNNDSPNIIMLQAKPDKSSALMTRLSREDTSPTQFENIRDKAMKFEWEASRRNV